MPYVELGTLSEVEQPAEVAQGAHVGAGRLQREHDRTGLTTTPQHALFGAGLEGLADRVPPDTEADLLALARKAASDRVTRGRDLVPEHGGQDLVARGGGLRRACLARESS